MVKIALKFSKYFQKKVDSSHIKIFEVIVNLLNCKIFKTNIWTKLYIINYIKIIRINYKKIRNFVALNKLNSLKML